MKFSILVPAYKPQFLAECIESILAQTYPDWELILVNDASPYDIDSIVRRYDDRRIRYRTRDKGYGAVRLVDNWNDCLNDASGDYVINMGDDDKLLPNCLADYVSLINKYPGKNIYHMRTEIIDEHSEVKDIQEDRPEVESVYSMVWHFCKGRRQWIGDWLFKTNTLKRIGGFFVLPCAWGSDSISAFIAAKDTGVANTHVPGFQYRNSSCSVSNNSKMSFDKMEAWIEVEQWFTQFLSNAPADKLDMIYRKLTSERIAGKIDSNRMFDLYENIYHHPSTIFRWMKRHKEFHISWRLLLTAVVLAVKDKVLRK